MDSDNDNFLEVNGGDDSDSSVDGGGDDFFTFGGGVIDVDEIFGGIDIDQMDGGGSIVIHSGKKYNQTGIESNGNPEFKLENEYKEPIVGPEDKKAEDGPGDGPEDSPVVEKQVDKKAEYEKQVDEKTEGGIVVRKSEDEYDAKSFVESVHEQDVKGGGRDICVMISSLLPDIFEPVLDT